RVLSADGRGLWDGTQHSTLVTQRSPQPSRQDCLLPRIVVELVQRALRALHFQLGAGDGVDGVLQLRRLVAELVGLESEGEEGADLLANLFRAIVEELQLLSGPSYRLLLRASGAPPRPLILRLCNLLGRRQRHVQWLEPSRRAAAVVFQRAEPAGAPVGRRLRP